ncbi:unnamed protein product [Amoebophrya sp. A120]|nr:unnamed protein product [Amoebophrya sp. A120]|eukprot:GSA120T00003729001.1
MKGSTGVKAKGVMKSMKKADKLAVADQQKMQQVVKEKVNITSVKMAVIRENTIGSKITPNTFRSRQPSLQKYCRVFRNGILVPYFNPTAVRKAKQAQRKRRDKAGAGKNAKKTENEEDAPVGKKAEEKDAEADALLSPEDDENSASDSDSASSDQEEDSERVETGKNSMKKQKGKGRGKKGKKGAKKGTKDKNMKTSGSLTTKKGKHGDNLEGGEDEEDFPGSSSSDEENEDEDGDLYPVDPDLDEQFVENLAFPVNLRQDFLESIWAQQALVIRNNPIAAHSRVHLSHSAPVLEDAMTFANKSSSTTSKEKLKLWAGEVFKSSVQTLAKAKHSSLRPDLPKAAFPDHFVAIPRDLENATKADEFQVWNARFSSGFTLASYVPLDFARFQEAERRLGQVPPQLLQALMSAYREDDGLPEGHNSGEEKSASKMDEKSGDGSEEGSTKDDEMGGDKSCSEEINSDEDMEVEGMSRRRLLYGPNFDETQAGVKRRMEVKRFMERYHALVENYLYNLDIEALVQNTPENSRGEQEVFVWMDPNLENSATTQKKDSLKPLLSSTGALRRYLNDVEAEVQAECDRLEEVAKKRALKKESDPTSSIAAKANNATTSSGTNKRVRSYSEESSSEEPPIHKTSYEEAVAVGYVERRHQAENGPELSAEPQKQRLPLFSRKFENPREALDLFRRLPNASALYFRAPELLEQKALPAFMKELGFDFAGFFENIGEPDEQAEIPEKWQSGEEDSEIDMESEEDEDSDEEAAEQGKTTLTSSKQKKPAAKKKQQAKKKKKEKEESQSDAGDGEEQDAIKERVDEDVKMDDAEEDASNAGGRGGPARGRAKSKAAAKKARAEQLLSEDEDSGMEFDTETPTWSRSLQNELKQTRSCEIETFISKKGHITDWHQDFQENFTIQLQGVKRWYIRKGRVQEPILGITPHYDVEKGDATRENELKHNLVHQTAGDALLSSKGHDYEDWAGNAHPAQCSRLGCGGGEGATVTVYNPRRGSWRTQSEDFDLQQDFYHPDDASTSDSEMERALRMSRARGPSSARGNKDSADPANDPAAKKQIQKERYATEDLFGKVRGRCDPRSAQARKNKDLQPPYGESATDYRPEDEPLEESCDVIDLFPGDIMYFPSGMWHKVFTVSEEPSISINFSLNGRRWCDVIGDSLKQVMARHPSLRQKVVGCFTQEDFRARAGEQLVTAARFLSSSLGIRAAPTRPNPDHDKKSSRPPPPLEQPKLQIAEGALLQRALLPSNVMMGTRYRSIDLVQYLLSDVARVDHNHGHLDTMPTQKQYFLSGLSKRTEFSDVKTGWLGDDIGVDQLYWLSRVQCLVPAGKTELSFGKESHLGQILQEVADREHCFPWGWEIKMREKESQKRHAKRVKSGQFTEEELEAEAERDAKTDCEQAKQAEEEDAIRPLGASYILHANYHDGPSASRLELHAVYDRNWYDPLDSNDKCGMTQFEFAYLIGLLEFVVKAQTDAIARPGVVLHHLVSAWMREYERFCVYLKTQQKVEKEQPAASSNHAGTKSRTAASTSSSSGGNYKQGAPTASKSLSTPPLVRDENVRTTLRKVHHCGAEMIHQTNTFKSVLFQRTHDKDEFNSIKNQGDKNESDGEDEQQHGLQRDDKASEYFKKLVEAHQRKVQKKYQLPRLHRLGMLVWNLLLREGLLLPPQHIKFNDRFNDPSRLHGSSEFERLMQSMGM